MLKKIDFILDSGLKKIIFIFFIIITIISLLEIISIGLLIPLITTILDENFITNFIKHHIVFLSQYSDSQIIILMVSVIAFIYFVKAISLIFFSWLQFSYVAKLEATLSKKLYQSYLIRPYKFFTKVNSSELIRNVTEEVNRFTYYIIYQGLTLFLEIIIVFFISIFLFIFNPKITVLLLLFCIIISLLMVKMTKNKITNWSKERQFHGKMKIQHIQQGIGGIKEIKILGNEENFLKYYDKHNQRYASLDKYFNMVSQSPRIILEFFAILFFIFIIISSYVSGIKNTEILVILGVFSAAAFRLIPSFNRINVGFQTLRYGITSIDVLYDEKLSLNKKEGISFVEKKINVLEKTNFFTSKIKIKDLSFSYDSDNVLEDINLEIKKNSVVGIIGKSGAGKSTFVDLLLGLYTPNKGKIFVDESDLSLSGNSWRNLIGYVPQNIYLLDDTLRKNVALGINDNLIDDKRVRLSLKFSQLDDFIENNLENGINTNIGERGIKLSGGQKQRIGIARALYKNPEIIILDEATSSLDLDTEKKLIDTIQNIKHGKTIIIISHRLSTLKICDQIYEIKNKKLYTYNKKVSNE